MNFVFVDETGDPGSDVSRGASLYFGMALLSVEGKNYEAIRLLLSQIHWLRGIATSIAFPRNFNKTHNLMIGLKELANHGVVSASGLYINKKDYGGRYLRWSDVNVPPEEWTYHLRNYILRHLLEFHFEGLGNLTEPMDLVVDRILLTKRQRENTFAYLNSKTEISLREPFLIPPIEHLTICDSEYVGGLEIAHVLADILREIIKGNINREVRVISDFMKIKHFVGHKKDEA